MRWCREERPIHLRSCSRTFLFAHSSSVASFRKAVPAAERSRAGLETIDRVALNRITTIGDREASDSRQHSAVQRGRDQRRFRTRAKRSGDQTASKWRASGSPDV